VTENDLIEYHKKAQYPSHGKALTAVIVVVGAFLALGTLGLLNIVTLYLGDVMSIITDIASALSLPEWLSGNIAVVILILGVLLLLSMIMAVGASALAKRMGATLIYIGAFFMNIMTWAIVVILFVTTGFNFSVLAASWPVMIPGVLTLFMTLLLFTVFRARIKRAGEIIKLTGQVCLDEKGVFVPPLVTMLFTLISAAMFGGILFLFPNVGDILSAIVGTQDWTVETALPLGIVLVVYLFATIFFYNLAYATSSAMAYIYIRGRDPTLGDGVKAALGVIGGLAALALMSVVVVIVRIALQRAGRRVGGPVGESVGRAAGGVIGWIWALVNYFTIPAMVAESLGARAGIKRSIGLVRHNFVDVMIKETAVRWAFGVLSATFFIAFAVGGALIGWFASSYDIVTTIVMMIVFIVFAAIPSALVLRTFDIVYVTLLYVFIRQQEGDIREKTAIPGPLEDDLAATYRDAKRSQ